ncbi:hopanoid biosynthesis associated protein HpnK [Caballeronia temeraria]|uniref:Hopanoid biosynthesis associated protein HpnK n=1 Tax=Caballeronia temeraria TaxID=1777137 RepID=A0A158CCJ2_9BURK|nr:hopanoid biosynthesis-associated protein HpnK [Caballeronia temeraria]SAK80012.1 hopanoid biosynthesis associated protein HpnK [Caballeronia temeraria]
MRGLIVTADDFGLHERVNDAVARAHREGVLTCASLMAGARAAHHAVKIARELPALRIGLHLVLTDGVASLPHGSIPDLVDARGNFESSMFENGVRFYFLPGVRRQLAREIHAQFEAFAATGLELDHVNVHKHFHLHPTVLELILEIGAQFGMRAMRLPRERHGSLFLAPWIARVKKRLDDAGIVHNDWVAGIAQTGRMDEAALLALLAKAPDGVLEIYSHPATAGGPLTPSMRNYRHEDELVALCSPRVARAIEATGAMHGGFADVFGAQEAERTNALARERA